MKCICINFHSEFRFHVGKHSEVKGLSSIGIPFVSVSVWSKDAYLLLVTAVKRTLRNKEFIVKDSAEWCEKFNAAMEEYKEGIEKDYKYDVNRTYKTIYEKDKRISDLLDENMALRKVIKICSEDDVNAKFERGETK